MPDILSKTNQMRGYTRSSSFIMAVLFTVLCGLAAVSLGYFINYFAKGHFVQSTEAVLDADIRYIQLRGIDSDMPEIAGHIYMRIENGKIPRVMQDDITVLSEGILTFTDEDTNRIYASKIHTSDDGTQILVGYDITKISNDFRFMQWIGMASIIFVVIVVFISYVISIFVARGTSRIANTAQDIINTGDLSRRLEVTSRWDDLGYMTDVLNSLLSRIEELMRGVRQVSDNIAHDLRTPLTRMRGTMESLPDSTEKETLLEEADHLLDTFNALLRISRIEAEKQRSHFDTVDISAVINDVIEFYEPLAEEKNIDFITDIQPASCHGDRDLLFQAFANMVDNAIKFTPDAGMINVDLTDSEGLAQLIIADSGPGVPDNEKDKVFDRFYRTAVCRSTAGTGLGLSLVGAVIDLHGGSIRLEDNNPGLRIITII